MNARRQERYQPLNVLEAINLLDNRFLGTVANISAGGFLLTSQSQDITEGSIFQFQLRERHDDKVIDVASFGASCLWSSEASTPDTWWSGFQIIDILPQDEQNISRFIEKLQH